MIFTRAFVLLLVCTMFPAHAQQFGPKSGALYLAGGGFKEPAIISKFVELAGGPDAHIVVIPTGSKIADDADAEDKLRRFFEERGGAKNISILHTRDRNAADAKAFAAPLATADAVWLWGGQARRLTDVYLNTETQDALAAVLTRGGLIGGASSGAVVMSDLIIRPGGAETSDILKANNIEGFGFVKGLLLDVHAVMRNRVFNMAKILPDYPDRIGVSIDENTAIILKTTFLKSSGAPMSSFTTCKAATSRSFF